MSAPDLSDGIRRAFEEIGLPSIAVIIIVVFATEYLGEIMAGLIFVVLTSAVLYLMYESATYWNTEYTIAFVGCSIFLWITVPGVISEFVHSVFGIIAQLITGIFLVFMVLLLSDKIEIEDII